MKIADEQNKMDNHQRQASQSQATSEESSGNLKESPVIKITQESGENNKIDSRAPKEELAHSNKVTANYDKKTRQMSSKIEAANKSGAPKNAVELEDRGQGGSRTKVVEKTDGGNGNSNISGTKGTNSIISNNNNNNENVNQPLEEIHVYKSRFFILALFCAYSAINSFQWIEYSSITAVISDYYGASNLQVNLTSLVYMITYIPFIIQASIMLEQVGLRKAVLLGTFGTALGSLIKWQLGGEPGMTAFWWMMLGQTIVALSQLYIISIPPLLAAVWFPDDQVSTATGIGVFGNQLGIALGFIIPPLVLSDIKAGKEVIGADLNFLARVVFWVSFIICLVSIVTFRDKPPKPPGSASLHAAQEHDSQPKIQAYASILELCKSSDFRYLILSYGINVGVFYAVSTVLNQMVFNIWPDLPDLAGRMGLLIVVSGMAGSVTCGQILDRTHAYKLIIVLIYLFSLVSMVLFTLVLELLNLVWLLYLASITLGYFMTGYLPLGFEFAAEITYPHPANTPAGLLNLSAQVFGLILTYVSSFMVDYIGNLWANIFLTVCLAVGLVLTVLMKADLKRQRAVAEEQLKC